MAYKNSDEEREILKALHVLKGTWPGVSSFLAKHSKHSVNQATLNLVSRGERNSRSVTTALVAAGLYTPPPRTDVRRCWKGTQEDAQQIDRYVRSCGYSSLSEYVTRTILEKHGECNYD